jgi:hypothetical protein
MNNMETKLNLLIDGLRKKEQALLEIVSITENQGTVLESELPAEEAQAFVTQMNREKQVHIQVVIQCDNMFESVLKEIGKKLDKEVDLYKPQVQVIQEHIKKVMDLDVKVRVLEDKNNQRIQSKRIGEAAGNYQKKPGIQAKDTQRIIDAYKNNARN